MEYHLELLSCLINVSADFSEKILTKEYVPASQILKLKAVYRNLQHCSILCNEIAECYKKEKEDGKEN